MDTTIYRAYTEEILLMRFRRTIASCRDSINESIHLKRPARVIYGLLYIFRLNRDARAQCECRHRNGVRLRRSYSSENFGATSRLNSGIANEGRQPASV